MARDKTQRLDYRTLFRLYRVFARYYRKHWVLLAVTYTGMLLTVLTALLMPWPLKLILDHVIWKRPFPPEAAFVTEWTGSDPYRLLLALVLAFIVIRVLASGVSYLYRVGMLAASEKIAADVREHIFAHLQRLSLSFHGAARTGDLVYRLTADIDDVKVVLVQLPQVIVYRAVMIGSHVALMLALEWRLALLASGVLPFLYYFHARFGSGVSKAAQKKKTKESDISALISENVTAMALVQAYGREDLQQDRFATENRASLQSGIEALRLSKAFKRISDLLIAIGTAAVAAYGGLLALAGNLSPGTLVLFMAYLRNVYRPLEKLAEMMLKVSRSQVSARRLLELIDCDMVMRDSPRATALEACSGEIEFRDVSFAYRRGQDVLHDLSFKIRPGERVALVGHSGAGKSTLVGLLLRFYDPRRGSVTIDGQDLRQVTLRSLRDQISVVMQEAPLLNQSVTDNIAFGRVGATDAQVVRAAHQAQAHGFVSRMPKGYDTRIAEGGDNLSGGQKQRIHIARAMVRDAPIVILDEPTTALDARSAARVHDALARLTEDKTVLIVAHNFSTLAGVDRILVLDRGRVSAFGRHDELLQTSPLYRELYDLQFGVTATPALAPGEG